MQIDRRERRRFRRGMQTIIAGDHADDACHAARRVLQRRHRTSRQIIWRNPKPVDLRNSCKMHVGDRSPRRPHPGFHAPATRQVPSRAGLCKHGSALQKPRNTGAHLHQSATKFDAILHSPDPRLTNPPWHLIADRHGLKSEHGPRRLPRRGSNVPQAGTETDRFRLV